MALSPLIAERLLMYALRDLQARNALDDASVSVLADMSGLSMDTVRRVLRRLRSQGLIDYQPGGGAERGVIRLLDAPQIAVGQ